MSKYLPILRKAFGKFFVFLFRKDNSNRLPLFNIAPLFQFGIIFKAYLK